MVGGGAGGGGWEVSHMEASWELSLSQDSWGEDRPVCQEAKEWIFTCRPSSPHPQPERSPISGFERREPGQGGGKGRQDPG